MRDLPQAKEILAWYDRHARDMPWRVSPADRRAGKRPDPYAVWLSEVMLQQTTVAAVRGYFHRFTLRWPTVADLAAAEDTQVMAEWAGLGYYARARNLLKCARTVVEEYDGRFPDSAEALKDLPGIGPYTAAAIAAIAFDRPETVVDGNVERVMARLFDVVTPLPTAKPELTMLAEDLTPLERPGDYAQAVMDLGATICTPRNPACGICPWRTPCMARAAGTAPDLPRKLPKKARPVRVGYAYVGRRADGAWLLERRPDSGLLGGMLGWPGSEWAEVQPDRAPPLAADWQMLGEEARHTFTHFHLRLKVLIADLPVDATPDRGHFVDRHEFRPSDLPTAMRKVFDLARSAFAVESAGAGKDTGHG
ncbi:A/G-specific DNA-adenine glycosylase [Lutimaribacter pacificus]|uniref:Adenine DNA glycosylase n=1 Tax=Lutimaribacter pacificus TaxID=391948 RepID=A0A1H0NVW7_9RHOB|nr:A/G-specific adenine glycosylase [Lutimaribacter pacificus]SDO96668.1 A/G-specific DNA-adenine glycosylase [Lutimaribacter pacificus]SHK94642.1 A/G-specific DNA-adenine glycosylase [Lutimaribacter pacificus]